MLAGSEYSVLVPSTVRQAFASSGNISPGFHSGSLALSPGADVPASKIIHSIVTAVGELGDDDGG
jgi:homoserine kinase